MAQTMEAEFLIVGGGLAGLACATLLEQAGADWLLLEAEDCLGGRVQTDRSIDGFLIDRGFQVLNTAYPALARMVDLPKLSLGAFHPGAEVFWNNTFHRLGDPLRRPQDIFRTLSAPIGGLFDKVKILELVCFCRNPLHQNMVNGLTSEEFLSDFGFSSNIIDRFFRPFFGGVFLEEELLTSAAKFVQLFSYFSRGMAALPAQGMQALPEQMAENLPSERLLTGWKVEAWKKNSLESGESKAKGRVLILAAQELQSYLLNLPHHPSHSATTLAFSVPKTPHLASPFLRLNGSPGGLLQTVAFNSAAQPSYAPEDRELAMVSCRRKCGPSEVLEELMLWFGDSVKQWRHLKTDHIKRALPVEYGRLGSVPLREEKGFQILCCGDHLETGSIQGALTSGRKAATLALGLPRL